MTALIPHRIHERLMEWRLGIRTAGLWRPGALPTDRQYHDYTPASYRAIGYLLDQAQPVGTFIDYGCGQGRVLVMAAPRPFRRVIGVELCPQLCTDARKNIEASKRFHRCAEVSVVNADATAWTVPDDATVLFFANSFSGEIARRVWSRVEDSLQRNPRALTVLVYNRQRMMEEVGAGAYATRYAFRQFDAIHTSATAFQVVHPILSESPVPG
jgi:SAM-dependent methyltransferase